jgi:hypothetical protein
MANSASRQNVIGLVIKSNDTILNMRLSAALLIAFEIPLMPGSITNKLIKKSTTVHFNSDVTILYGDILVSMILFNEKNLIYDVLIISLDL